MYKYFIFLIVLVILAFKNIFWGHLGSFGDAPFFYEDVINTLFSEPSVWITRGINFGGINQSLWLSPLMVIYGAMGKFLLFDNQTIIRVLFYIPAIVLSIVGPFILTRYLKFSKTVSFSSSFFYCLNTYFLLLIDGGQVGIALAYGIFPVTLYFVKRLVDSNSTLNFFFAYLFSMLLCIVDPRIYAILVLLLVLWVVLEKKSLKYIILLQIPVLLSNMYWLYPLLEIGSNGIGNSAVNLQTSSLLNSIFLYAPHWPDNIFGKTIPPTFYFLAIPILLFGSFLFVQSRESKEYQTTKIVAVLFLIFAFLAKGTVLPFGQIYDFLITQIPFGVAFRDSSKFFVPLMLLGGVLIGVTVEKIRLKFKFFEVIAFVYIIFLVCPVFFGKLNFNLSRRIESSDFEKIKINIKQSEGDFKTLWVPEKNALSYETNNKPAIDARELVKLAGIGSINASEDPFNFLNDINFPSRLARLGIRYIFLSGDPRNLKPNENEIKDWETVIKLISENASLNKLNWDTDISVYEIKNVLPKFFKVDSLVGIIGPHMEINEPAVYFEDGKLDPRLLELKNAKSVRLLFNGKNELDLAMSFLQKYFVGIGEAKSSDWAYYPSESYLKAKYQLLLRDVEYNDFDYGKGLAFSTKKGESIKFSLDVKSDNEYVLVVRKIDETGHFKWEILNSRLSLKKGNFDYKIINDQELNIVNVVALIPKIDFDEAQKLGNTFTTHFEVIEASTAKNYKWGNVEIDNEGTSKYKVLPNESGFWVVLNESYNPLWKIRKGTEVFNSLPIDSQVNGFYIEPTWNNLHIEFEGQSYFRWGLYYSLVSISGTLIVLLFKYINNEEAN